MLQNGCMPVAWGLLWRGSRSIHARLSGDAAKHCILTLHDCCMELAVGRKPERETLCFFPAKVAAAGNQGQFVCEAVAGTFFGSHTVTVASSCFGCVCVCAWVRAVEGCFGPCGCRWQRNGCMIVVTFIEQGKSVVCHNAMSLRMVKTS